MDISIICRSPLFSGMTEEEAAAALPALRAEERSYSRGDMVFTSGDVTTRLGIVVSGGVTVEMVDMLGVRTVLTHVGAGQFFAETYAILREPMLVDVCAVEACVILFLDLAALDGRREPWVSRLTKNLLTITARKNIGLSYRSFFTTPKSVRGRITAYLGYVAAGCRSDSFDIPFDRQQLADHLNVDRSALSKELGRMRDEGLISFRKNRFTILKEM